MARIHKAGLEINALGQRLPTDTHFADRPRDTFGIDGKHKGESPTVKVEKKPIR